MRFLPAPLLPQVYPLTKPEFLKEVTEASKDGQYVCVLLFQDSVVESRVVEELFSLLARKFPSTKFMKIISTQCIENFPDRCAPVLPHSVCFVHSVVCAWLCVVWLCVQAVCGELCVRVYVCLSCMRVRMLCVCLCVSLFLAATCPRCWCTTTATWPLSSSAARRLAAPALRWRVRGRCGSLPS